MSPFYKLYDLIIHYLVLGSSNSDIQWCFSQVKGTLEDDATEGNINYPVFFFVIFKNFSFPNPEYAFSRSIV